MDTLGPPSKPLPPLSEAAAREFDFAHFWEAGLQARGRWLEQHRPLPACSASAASGCMGVSRAQGTQGHPTPPLPRSASSPWLSLATCQSVSNCVYLRVALCFWLMLAVAGGCIRAHLSCWLGLSVSVSVTTTSCLCRLTISLHLTFCPGLCFSIFFCL